MKNLTLKHDGEVTINRSFAAPRSRVWGYFVDPEAEVIRRHEERAVRLREKRMGGRLKAVTQPKGASFIIELPVATQV